MAGLRPFLFGSILRRQTLLVASFVLVTAGVVIGLGLYVEGEYRRTGLESQLTQAADLRQKILTGYMAQQEGRVRLVANRTYLGRLMFRRHASDTERAAAGMEPVDPDEFLRETEAILLDALGDLDDFVVLSIVSPEGEVLSSTDAGEVGQRLSGEAVPGPAREAYFAGLEGPSFGDPWSLGGGIRHAYLSAPVRQAGQTVGVVLVELDLAELQDLLRPSDYLPLVVGTFVGRVDHGQVEYLLGRQRQHGRIDEGGWVEQAMRRAFIGQTGTDNTGRFLTAFRPVDVKNRRWALVVAIDRSEAFAAFDDVRSWILPVVLLIMLLAVAASYWLARYMTRPIQDLSRAAKRLRAGDFSARAEVRSNDEIGALGRAFNGMALAVSLSQAELEERVQERTRQLASAKEEAERATRAKSEFMAIASHDLRNPLARILGFARLLRRRVPEGASMNADGAEMLDLVERGARTMQQIVEDYLELEAMRSGTMPLARVPLDVNGIVREMLRDMRPLADQRRITLEADLDSTAPAVPADRHRIGQVLQNLLDNALKYGADYDEVTVRTRVVGENLFVEVSDTGPGVQPDEISTLFERGTVLTRPSRSGEKSTHMGLSVCRWILELHGGEIGVRNNRGQGACFWFRLPLGEQGGEDEADSDEERRTA